MVPDKIRAATCIYRKTDTWWGERWARTRVPDNPVHFLLRVTPRLYENPIRRNDLALATVGKRSGFFFRKNTLQTLGAVTTPQTTAAGDEASPNTRSTVAGDAPKQVRRVEDE